MKKTELPTWAQQVLHSCPNTGDGVHNWLFIAGLKLNHLVPNKAELAHLLRDATGNCGREVSAREIDSAIRNSQVRANNPQPVGSRTPRWSSRDEKQIRAILRDGPSLEQLASLSPVQFSDGYPHTAEIVDALFPGNPLLCVARRKERPMTTTKEALRRHLSHQQFIVPSPMRSLFGRTQEGGMSMRCLGNTGPRRFLVVEFDQGTFNEHAAILAHLGEQEPLVLVVHSGNKSLHGWFYCAGQPDERVERFFNYAVSLGADRATWTKCQLVRMPDGRRDNGKRQRIVFFNPESLEVV